MITPEEEHAATELARASRLELMANSLLVEVGEIRSRYAKKAPKRPRKSLKEIAVEKGWMHPPCRPRKQHA